MTTGAQVAALALTYQTKRDARYQYRLGGKGPFEFDCSGLVKRVFDQLGALPLPHGTAAQEEWFRRFGRALPAGSGLVTAGAVAFGVGHNGIIVGDGNSMDARNEHYDLAAFDATINFPRNSARFYMHPDITYKVITHLPVRQHDRCPVVGWVQAALNARGYRLLVDDHFGGLTDDAVRRFQRSANLFVDGVAGPITQRALGL